MRLIFRPGQETPDARKAWLAAIWLLAHLGGLGSRSRRGVGSLKLVNWEGWKECDSLKFCVATNAADWRAELQTGLTTICRSWFTVPATIDHSVLDDKCAIYLLRQSYSDWEKALNEAGLLLQRFRQLRQPDYQEVKEHIAWRDKLPVSVAAQVQMTHAPEGAAFGLPSIRRYQSLNGHLIAFEGTEHGRQASPLWLRVVKIGDRYHPMFFTLSTPFLAPNEQIKDHDHASDTFALPPRDVLNTFITEAIVTPRRALDPVVP